MTPLEQSRIPLWQLELGAGDRSPTSVWQDIKRERLERKRPGKQNQVRCRMWPGWGMGESAEPGSSPAAGPPWSRFQQLLQTVYSS